MVRNGGILTAVNSTDGRIIFDERLGAAGQYSASSVLANDHVYVLSNKGVVSVVKFGDRFELAHQHDLGEPAFVSPAIDRDTIYIRTESHLHAFRQGE